MIGRKDIEKVIDTAKTLKVLVVGDAMIDRYIYGSVDRISPEAPVPVLSLQRSEVKAGGAANVALNMAAWGCTTTMIGITGKDSHSNTLAELLDTHSIHHHLIQLDARPTTVKTRVVSGGHHLIRIDEESSVYLSGSVENGAIQQVCSVVDQLKPDIIILEDYNKGFLTSRLIKEVIRVGKNHGAFIGVDPKEHNFFMYEGVDLFKPNLREAGQAAHRALSTGDLSQLCHRWREQMRIASMAITLGSGGIYVQDEKTDIQLLPDRAIDVVDVCGAGDTVIGAMSVGLRGGLGLKGSGYLANLAGAYVCSHSGVVTVDIPGLYQWL